jgi:hypothetical protein
VLNSFRGSAMLLGEERGFRERDLYLEKGSMKEGGRKNGCRN